ncbi:MAG: hypothetical protein WCQ76_03755 [Fusobacterium sp.]
MIASTIGRTFLKAYNKKYNKNYSAKEFFDKVYFQYFFNSKKYMQWVTNSPFVQMKAGQKVDKLNDTERKEKLENLHEKIDKGECDASIAIGFPAAEGKEFATTSGLVTDINLKIDKEDIYYSWIGGGFGIGVAGGYSIYFDNVELLLVLFEGWKVYRKYLDDKTLEKLRGNQINTWNGQWLNFFFGNDYVEDFDFNTLQNIDIFKVSDTVLEVNTIKWSKLFFSLSNKFSNSSLIGYVFSLGQTNKTLGFYSFYFNKAEGLRKFYRRLFGDQAAIKQAKQYEELFGIHIKRACELGTFGLKALEPKDLRKYYGDSSTLKLTKPNLNIKKGEDTNAYEERKKKLLKKDNENLIYYRTYKTWLLAMITKNKEESLEYTKEVAEALQRYRKRTNKTDRINLIKTELLASKSKKAFINTLVKIVESTKEDILKGNAEDLELNIYKSLRDRIHMMNTEDFGYFVVLLKFDFAYVERENNIN